MPAGLIWGLALTVALGGGALAALPRPDGVITGCVADDTGALRVVGEGEGCSGREFAVSWNHPGPAGPAGSRGSTGPSGTSAPAGPPATTAPAGFGAAPDALTAKEKKALKETGGEPTSGYSAFRDEEVVVPPGDEQFVTVARLKLPAGRWFLTAKATLLQYDGFRFSNAVCRLQAANAHDQHVVLLSSPLFIAFTARLTTPGAAELRCFGVPYNVPFQNDGYAHVSWIKVTAIRLARETVQ